MVNTTTTDAQETGFGRVVASDSSGRFVVVWVDRSGLDGGLTSISGQRYDADGSPIGSEFLVNSVTTDHQLWPAVAMDADGDFVAVWEDYSGGDGSGHRIAGQRFDATGSPQGGEFQANTVTTDDQSAPAVAMDADGNFVVVWEDASGADGSGLRIAGQRYDAAGTPQGGEFQVNTVTTGAQRDPSIAMNGNGDFVVAWADLNGDGSSSRIAAQRFGPDGTLLGGEFQVNTVTTAPQSLPAVAMDADGDFVVVWEDYSGEDGSGSGIAGQRFDSTGSALGVEFQVNTITSYYQRVPEVAMDPAGRFVVAWADHSGYYPTVRAQRYDAVGGGLGGEFEVATDTTTYKNWPSVAMDASGAFVVVWTSDYQDGDGVGVFGQRFEGYGGTSTTTTTLPPGGGDVGITGKKLVIVDKFTAASKAKFAYVAKDTPADKGVSNDATMIGATFDAQITGLPSATAAHFDMPQGAGWLINKPTVAKYVNKAAPTGGGVKVSVIKPTKLLKMVGKSLGDSPVDIYQGGAPAASVDVATQYTVVDGGATRQHCGEFTDCKRKIIAGGTGAKVVCKTAVPGASVTCP